jgi:hypothetical protein
MNVPKTMVCKICKNRYAIKTNTPYFNIHVVAPDHKKVKVLLFREDASCGELKAPPRFLATVILQRSKELSESCYGIAKTVEKKYTTYKVHIRGKTAISKV